jgi:hypothetical protein
MPRLSAVVYDAEAQRGQIAVIPAISGIREATSGASPLQLVLRDRAPEALERDRLRLGANPPAGVEGVDRRELLGGEFEVDDLTRAACRRGSGRVPC